MRLADTLHYPWRLLPLAVLVGALAVAGLSSQSAKAAPAVPMRPLVGCAPCISQVTPPDGSTATLDPDGKVTISFTAQLNNTFVKFVFSLDNTPVDAALIQVSDPDPTQPTGTYRAVLSGGQHTAFVQAFDTTGPVAAFNWKFTAPQPPTPTPTPTKTPAGGSGGNGSANTTGSSGLLAPKTLSIILFSIAGVGLLVMAFIAGMWYSGRRSLRNQP